MRLAVDFFSRKAEPECLIDSECLVNDYSGMAGANIRWLSRPGIRLATCGLVVPANSSIGFGHGGRNHDDKIRQAGIFLQ